ncbi:hypothetical protein DFH06DRAFT_1363845 [Mycena polygramma]|nr:hypothetical protein DFH06DRAFT_1363845 [Mycena polygramma]
MYDCLAQWVLLGLRAIACAWQTEFGSFCKFSVFTVQRVLNDLGSGENPDAWDGRKIRRTSSPRLRGCGITDPAATMKTVSQRVKGPNEYRVRVGGPKKNEAARARCGAGKRVSLAADGSAEQERSAHVSSPSIINLILGPTIVPHEDIEINL